MDESDLLPAERAKHLPRCVGPEEVPRVDEHAAAIPADLLAERDGISKTSQTAVRAKLERQPRAGLADRLGTAFEFGDGPRAVDWREERGNAGGGTRGRG